MREKVSLRALSFRIGIYERNSRLKLLKFPLLGDEMVGSVAARLLRAAISLFCEACIESFVKWREQELAAIDLREAGFPF